MTVSKIRKEITNSVTDALSLLGFDISQEPTYYQVQGGVIRIVHIDFLSKSNAAYFNSNTASFTLNMGVCLGSEGESDNYPKEYEAHIRGTLLNESAESPLLNSSDISSSHPDATRKDIWWIEQDGSNVSVILDRLSVVLNKNLMPWLDKHSDMGYIIDYLQSKKEIQPENGGPFGFGAVGSPLRQKLLKLLKSYNSEG